MGDGVGAHLEVEVKVAGDEVLSNGFSEGGGKRWGNSESSDEEGGGDLDHDDEKEGFVVVRRGRY